jgi:hypothetical protein
MIRKPEDSSETPLTSSLQRTGMNGPIEWGIEQVLDRPSFPDSLSTAMTAPRVIVATRSRQ